MEKQKSTDVTVPDVGTGTVIPTSQTSTCQNSQIDVEAANHKSNPPTPRGWRFYGSFGTLCLVTFIIALDSTIISVALPEIAEDIGASAIQAFWCGSSFLLASTVVQPPVASLSHIFGRKPTLLASLTLFTAGCIVAALAKGITLLLVGRTLQGLGSGGILALTYIITTDLVSLRERGKWFGLISLNWAVGTILGPLVGGALVRVSWPWLFWINLPFCAFAYVAIPVTLRLKKKEAALKKKFRQVDWIGTVVFVGSLTSFLIPLSWGGIMYDWTSPRTLAPMLIGIVGLILLGFYIKLVSKSSKIDPLIRPSLFSSGSAVSAFVATVIHGIIIWCGLYYVPLYQEVRGASPLGAGVDLMPWTGTVAPAAVLVGIAIARTGRYRPFIWVGWALTALGFGLQMIWKRHTKTYEWVLTGIVGGAGLGILFSAQAFAAQAAASNADLPFAASFYAFCRSLGQSLGVVIGGIIFQNEFRRALREKPEAAADADRWAKDASALIQVINRMPSSMRAIKEVIIGAYIDGLRTVWMVLGILGCVGLVISVVGVRHKTLDRELETDQGLVEKESHSPESLSST